MKKLLFALLTLAVLPLCLNASAQTLPYSRVYEPETSVALAPTIAWKADGMQFAAEPVRPATGFVTVDKDLRVSDENGELLCASLDEYIRATSGTVIPALYIESAETAAALRTYLEQSGLGDVFVCADHANAHLVRQVADLLHVRGMVDFRSLTDPDEAALAEIIRTTNASRAKVALLSEAAATKENVRYLQSRLITVWTDCGSSLKSLLTQYTNGVNGVLVSDYAKAIDALELFQDDAPTLLRPPLVIGHRGMPGMFTENTELSALGAYSAGADALETDIYLSADGELFVLHDSSLDRLFARADIGNAESLTLAELRSIPFDNESVQARNNTPASKTRYGSVALLPSQRIPSLRDIYALFRDSGMAQDTEIKSNNPETVAALKSLTEEMGNADEVFVITFNTTILDEMASTWPEMSVGALGTQGSKQPDGQPFFKDFARIIPESGVEKALELLYAELDRWNATYNPNRSFSYEIAVAGRHRGLTVWPWTYNQPEQFAEVYLQGIYGITTNFAWWASGFVDSLAARDAETTVNGVLPGPAVTTRSGERIRPENIELVVVEGSADAPGEALALYRSRQQLVIDGKAYGSYWLYSNPFTITVTE